MRSQLFRTDPVLIDGTAVVAALKDVDGIAPFTLFVENMDIAASGRTKFGSKNANLRFVAVAAGTGANAWSVVFHAAASQAFSIVIANNLPYASTITVNLQCDASGKPIQLATAVMDLMNADGPTAAIIRTVLAKGSDGGATMEVAVGTDATVALSGGFAAVTSGAVLVEISPTGAPDFAGPWSTVADAGTDLSTVSAGTVKRHTLFAGSTASPPAAADAPAKGLRVSVTKGGGGNTKVVVTAIGNRKF